MLPAEQSTVSCLCCLLQRCFFFPFHIPENRYFLKLIVYLVSCLLMNKSIISLTSLESRHVYGVNVALTNLTKLLAPKKVCVLGTGAY